MAEKVLMSIGLSIPAQEALRRAVEKIGRDKAGEPVHVCGRLGKRECDCHICIFKSCDVCFADILLHI